ncbi:MAG: sensor histidine kinase, partial [Sulfuricellaceae bacterium]|nr:sensor histidine kinase [Sulfuricellaceae bacterium]
VRRALAADVDLGFELETAPVRGVALLLQEMLANLLDNAIRYGGKGGQVTVRSGRVNGLSVLEVEDDGPGIPAEDRAHVFERFYRVAGSSGEGSGLGLAIVAEIAHAHGAEVGLSELATGKGARFSITFPVLP